MKENSDLFPFVSVILFPTLYHFNQCGLRSSVGISKFYIFRSFEKVQSEVSSYSKGLQSVSDIASDDFSQEQEKPEPMTLVFCDLDFFAYVFEKVTLRSKAILTECGYLTSVFKM